MGGNNNSYKRIDLEVMMGIECNLSPGFTSGFQAELGWSITCLCTRLTNRGIYSSGFQAELGWSITCLQSSYMVNKQGYI